MSFNLSAITTIFKKFESENDKKERKQDSFERFTQLIIFFERPLTKFKKHYEGENPEKYRSAEDWCAT